MSEGLATSAGSDNEAGGTGRKYYGKYRGVVLDNVDPMQIGRIMAMVPDVSSLLPTTWCMPCVPAAGLQAGMLAVPSIGAGVWIEFEQGDPDYPIWTGCFWGSAAELPVLTHLSPPGLSSLTFQTTLQNGIVVNDVPGPTGGIILKSATGAFVIVNDTGIYLSNGQGATITLVGPTVAINVAALVVT
jgi:Type VI secretion system/phage-baseplate injector OB domain